MDIWLFDLARAASIRFTFHPTTDGFAVWSPDSRRITFASTRDGAVNLYQKDVSEAGEEELLLKTPVNKWPTSWAPDGRWLLYHQGDPQSRQDLWLLALDRRQPTPWLRTEFDEGFGRFSPDSKWVAYESNESGRYEIHVRPFSPSGAAGVSRWVVSTGGGERPSWRGDGKELFYIGPDRKLMAVEVKSAGGQFEAGLPTALFATRADTTFGNVVYAVTSDGQRFLIRTEGEGAISQPTTVVVNWTAGLKK
jgi:Tol biopolymer transport system component